MSQRKLLNNKEGARLIGIGGMEILDKLRCVAQLRG